MNALTFPLLRFLSDGRHRTFGEIGDALGVSSTEITETLDGLLSTGLDIARDSGTGCRLTTLLPWLDASEIARYLGDHSCAFRLDIVDHTGSTNEDLMALARQGASTGLVRVAELQTAGRGRRRRIWHSGIGGALTFSLLWEFARGPAALSGLSLAVGVSLVRSLQALGVTDVTLKWPNDVLWRQGKLGGVLIETIGTVSGAVLAVIGIGLNLRLSGPVAERIDQAAVDLESAGLRAGRNQLLGRLLLDLQEVLSAYSRDGFAPFRREWEHAHAYQDKMIRLELADGAREEGRVIGVDDDGALLLSAVGGMRRFHDGELSMRPVDA
jgi:BirA family biotin operon repressor/biotin-[acetyl-CoA-carboxylase] ligase